MRPLILGLIVCCVLCDTRRAQASPLFEWLGDTSATGGLSARSVTGGSAAAYFNPSLLVDTEDTLSFGISVASQQIGVSLAGRPGTQFAVPEGIENATRADGSRFESYPIATKLLQRGRLMTARRSELAARPRQAVDSGHDTRAYGVLGMVTRLFGERLAVGVHAMLPVSELTKLRAFYSDEREQYFSNSLHPELYADRTTAISLALAVGVRITDSLSLGVGGTLGLGARVGAQAYVSDAGNLGKLLLDSDVPVRVSLSPHVGASYVIDRRLRLTATAHAARRVELDAELSFLLATGSQQAANVTLVYDYEPWLIGLGGSYEFVQAPELSWSVTIGAVYGVWSDYVDRHNERPSEAYAWADTITPTLGVRGRSGALTMFADVIYQPTPVPAQTGRTNYVDNDRVGGSFGVEYQRSVWGNAIRIGAQISAHRMLERQQSKLPTPTWPDGVVRAPDHVRDEVPDDAQINGLPLMSNSAGLQTNNPGWPGFGSHGWLLGVGLYLTVSR